IEMMAARNPDMAEQSQDLLARFKAMEPWLQGGRVHAPFWEVHATRVD
ncbi:MAG: class I SAM-dependent methyltransferase, partial [Mycobacterium sp.]|nr:class I SAM-dependent methyltransferase [Mycobacterium sp.]